MATFLQTWRRNKLGRCTDGKMSWDKQMKKEQLKLVGLIDKRARLRAEETVKNAEKLKRAAEKPGKMLYVYICGVKGFRAGMGRGNPKWLNLLYLTACWLNQACFVRQGVCLGARLRHTHTHCRLNHWHRNTRCIVTAKNKLHCVYN